MESSSDPPIPPKSHSDSIPAAIDEKERSEKEHEVNTSADLVAGWLGGAGKLLLLLYTKISDTAETEAGGGARKGGRPGYNGQCVRATAGIAPACRRGLGELYEPLEHPQRTS